jgi:hypothetical protein
MMHTVKKDELQKKICYRDRKLETTTLTPPRQHQKLRFSIKNASKKERVLKRRRRSIVDLRFPPSRKSSL